MVQDPKIVCDKAMKSGETPLWIAAERNRLPVVKWILATVNKVNIKAVWTGNRKSVAEIARLKGHTAVADLITSFEVDKKTVIRRLRVELGIAAVHASELYATIVCHCDDYTKISPLKRKTSAARFYNIAKKIPMELQMLLANRAFQVPEDVISIRLTEQAFKKVLGLL
jgi:hypothetical protein